jgi:putative FmdB family regulatory protein
VPTYEYACASCDTTHEVQQKMSDPTLTECPACGQSGLRKLFSGVGIHFKGSGFYRTDSRDSKTSTSTSTSSGSTGTSSDSSSGSSSPATTSTSTTSTSSSSAPATTSA